MNKIIIAMMLLLGAFSVYADTPVGPMNYQGRLLDNAGIPVTGSYNFVVRVYDAVSGGTLKYQENHNAVAVDDGVYNFLVGTQTKSGGDSTWSVELWNCCANLFMEIVVNGEALSPRHRLAAAPYAFQANLALTTNNALALGGKSAGNVLQDICKANKGKWLELANQGSGACLGIGSSFPGPTQVAINTLTASTDFSNVDLTNADISGINFGAANFTGATLKNTIVKGGSFTGANFTNSTWDGVTTTTAMTVNFNMRRAQMKNMSLALFSFTDVSKMNYLSAAYLSACPIALPGTGQWSCRVQTTSPGTVYHLAGWSNMPWYEGINYSRDSAYSDDSEGVARIKVDNFNNTTVFAADFRGMFIDQSFNGAGYGNANFTGADIWRVNFGAATGGGDGSVFDKAKLRFVNFSNYPTYTQLTSVSFANAVLDNVNFRDVELEGVSFQNVTMLNADFTSYGDNGAGVDFTGASIYNSKFWKVVQISGDFTNAKFFGAGPGSLPTFWLSDTRYMNFTGATLTDMVFDNTVTLTNTPFNNTTWINPYFGNSAGTSPFFTGVNFQGAKFLETTSSLWTNIPAANWAGARCPDGYLVPNPNTGNVKCNVGHLLP